MRTWIFIVALCLAALAAAGAYVVQPKLFDAVLPKPPTLAQAGGTRLTLGVDPKLDEAAAEKAATKSIPVLERRFDAMEWAGATVRREGRQLVIEVPGVDDGEAVATICSRQGRLSIRLVADDPSRSDEALEQVDTVGTLPIEGAPIVTGHNIVDASQSFDSKTQQAIVNFKFDKTGGERFARATRKNIGRPFAIILDGKVISAPRILGPIEGGVGRISGSFTRQSARELAILLRTGALPESVRVIANDHVPPER